MFGGIKRNATDALFSDLVRTLAGWKCERCFKSYENRRQGLHCSHFYGRRGKSTRWDVENAAALCFSCHNHMGENPAEHVKFFEKRLGLEKFEKLTLRANTPAIKVDEKMVRVYLKNELSKL